MQQNEWQYLLSRRDNNNLPHSLLITGQKGAGKTPFALAFAELLLCAEQGTKACGQCRSCKLFQAKSHPDFKFIQPEAGGKIIKIEQIRDVIDMLNKKAHQNGYQIIIIKPAHAMNNAASNALLKTLEEPQGQVMLMLLTEQPASLLPTIRSRCQRINFTQYLKPDNNTELENTFEKLRQRKLTPIEFAQKCKDLDVQIIIKSLQIWLLDIIKGQIQGSAGQTRGSAPTGFPVKGLFKCFDQLIEYNRYINNNLNKQLMLEDIGFRISNVS
jgi:DNA polymerase-3 subunit delta'